jgi:hypothetical protein
LPIKNQNPRVGSKSNTTCLPITLGGNHGSGHFYFALTRISRQSQAPQRDHRPGTGFSTTFHALKVRRWSSN